MHSHAINNTQICILKFQLQIYFAQFWSPWIKLVPDLDKILCHPVEFSEQIGAHDDWCMCTYKSLSNISANMAKPSQFQCRISIVEYIKRYGKTCTCKQLVINLSQSLWTLMLWSWRKLQRYQHATYTNKQIYKYTNMRCCIYKYGVICKMPTGNGSWGALPNAHRSA